MDSLRDLVGRWVYFSHSVNVYQTPSGAWTVPGVVTARGFTAYRTEVTLLLHRSALQDYNNSVNWRVGVRIGTAGFEGLALPTDDLKYLLWESGTFGPSMTNWAASGVSNAYNINYETIRLRSDAIYSGESPETLRVLAEAGTSIPAAGESRFMEVRGRVFVAEN